MPGLEIKKHKGENRMKTDTKKLVSENGHNSTSKYAYQMDKTKII